MGFLASLVLLTAAYAQEKPNLIGTYKPRFVFAKVKPSEEQRKEMLIFEKYTRLIVQKPGRYVITDGVTAHDGLWHIADKHLSLKPKGQPQSSKVSYYISLDTKKLTPVLTTPGKHYIEWNRISCSEKIPKRS